MKKIYYQEIEKKWQKKWERAKIFEANVDKKKKKFFITIPYPYVNGAPHIGAGFTFIRGDAYARFKRMQGFNVLLPQAFHATGEPIVGTIERLKKNDKSQIETFKLFGASDKDIKDFVKKGPQFIAQYWKDKWIEVLKMAGQSVDWRRTFITTTMTPTYSRFVEWQYNSLRKKGYVVQGTHPVIWCPHDQSPTGDHDRLKGEGESPVEYILIKFKLDTGEILPCGTLRPETIYGVTNIWVNPDVDYVGAEIDGETWIVSKEAAEKLKDQLKNVKMSGEISGSELIGKFVENPVTKEKIIVLPSSFCDSTAASGIVMSVPSHAPYDWVALNDLQKNPEQLSKYDIDPLIVKNIKPISLIKLEGFGEHPAIEISEKMGIKSQQEKEKLDEATAILYKKEFHTGVIKDDVTDYAKMNVSEVKDLVWKSMIEQKTADTIWECTAPVVCRCTTPCHVKILENQWFLKYSDEEWKNKVKKLIEGMKFYPEEARLQFLNTVDWLKDKACTRKSGLGTPLPWDKEWIIETLSDSTIYMAYYTISNVINQNKISAEKLTDELFDFVFLGKGNVEKISKKVKLNKKIIKEMRKQFEYFYPVDLRTSGKDLVQNHFTFFLFQHVATWDDPNYWPKSIAVNGYVKVMGSKMSKSLGNVVPLKDLISNIGADLTRINIVVSNENMDDAEWRDESVVSYISRIEILADLISQLKKSRRKTVEEIDRYMLSRMQLHIKDATQNYDLAKFRSVAQNTIFDFVNDLKWHIERVGGIKNCNRKVLADCLSTLVRLLSPIIPHICEDFWSKLGNKKFVSISEWPKYDEKLIVEKSIHMEENFKKTIEDLRNVIKLAGKKKNLYLYFVTDKEVDYFDQSLNFIKKQFNFKQIKIFRVSDKKKYDPQNKSAKAKFGKPGIYLE